MSYNVNNLGIFGAYALLIFVHAAAMFVTVFFVSEIPIQEVLSPSSCQERTYSFFHPFKAHDFRVVFFTRFLMQMGILTVQEYLQYYLKDAIGPTFVLGGHVVARDPTKAVSILFIPVLLGALISSLVAGVISDRLGGKRKAIIYVSGASMALSCVFFSITRSYALDMFLGLLFGVGFGAFSVMDWAMATDVLPHPAEFAKDMGIWSLALVLPQVLAAPIAGFLLDYGQRVNPSLNLGYSIIFFVAVVYFVSGTWFVRYIDNVD